MKTLEKQLVEALDKANRVTASLMHTKQLLNESQNEAKSWREKYIKACQQVVKVEYDHGATLAVLTETLTELEQLRNDIVSKTS